MADPDSAQERARKAYVDHPTDENGRAWLRAELTYYFQSTEDLDKMDLDNVLQRAQELMLKREGE